MQLCGYAAFFAALFSPHFFRNTRQAPPAFSLLLIYASAASEVSAVKAVSPPSTPRAAGASDDLFPKIFSGDPGGIVAHVESFAVGSAVAVFIFSGSVADDVAGDAGFFAFVIGSGYDARSCLDALIDYV